MESVTETAHVRTYGARQMNVNVNVRELPELDLTLLECRSLLSAARARARSLTRAAAAVQHNARTHSGPPSTGATITMDGGVAVTARANTTA